LLFEILRLAEFHPQKTIRVLPASCQLPMSNQAEHGIFIKAELPFMAVSSVRF
jgi:hypothetical protein